MSDEQDTTTRHSSQEHRSILSASARQQLRRELRQRRNATPITTQRAAATRIAQHLRRHVLQPGLRVAIYSAFDGEIDLAPTMRIAKRLHCTLYAPCITQAKARRMEFVELMPNTTRRNPFGMIEPRYTPKRRIDPRQLDLILTSVIAFDQYGWRLGFGGGYYDRKLAFKRVRKHQKPLLIGVGYEFQRVAAVMPAPWDVMVDAIVTETAWHRSR